MWAVLLVSICFVLPTRIWGSTDYNCNLWPNGLSSSSLFFVECAESLPSSWKKVPSQLWEGSNTRYIDISRNQLVGSLNVSSSLSHLIRSFLARNNLLSGPFPLQLPTALKRLDLSYNQFSSPLPITWNALVNMEEMNLRNNPLYSQHLPSSWGGLVKLHTLDLSNTGMSGEIPSSFAALSRLSSFLVEGCNFTGCVPVGLPFPQTGVTQLGGQLLLPCTATPSLSPSKVPTRMPTISWSPTSLPSQAPSLKPSLLPTFLPTMATWSPTSASPTVVDVLANAGNVDESVVAAGVGIGVTVVLIGGMCLLLYFKYVKPKRQQQTSAAATGAISNSHVVMERELANQNQAKNKTFVPGQGWVEDKTSRVQREARPPPPREETI